MGPYIIKYYVTERTNVNWWGFGGGPRLNPKGYKTLKTAKQAILKARRRAMKYDGPVFYIDEVREHVFKDMKV